MMIDSAFEALVHQRLHVVLSSDRPLALQHSALLLLRRLHQEPSVRVADEAPADPTELISHVNQIVAGLSLRQATDNAESVSRLAILPVRVGPDRPADSIALLIRLCRALPGTGLRLLLIIEHEPAVEACMRALSGAAYHWDIRPQPAADVDRPAIAPHALASHASDGAQAAPPARAEALDSKQPISQPDNAGPLNPAAPLPPDSATGRVSPVIQPAGWFSKLADSASRRPLRFALVVAGIPGLLIAGVLALGSALQPSRSGSSPSAAGPNTTTPATSPARPAATAAPSPAPSPAPAPPPTPVTAPPPPAPAPATAATPPAAPPASKPATTPTPAQAPPPPTAKPASGPPAPVAAQGPAAPPAQAPAPSAAQPPVPAPAQAVTAAPVASNTPPAQPAAATAPANNAPPAERRTAPEPAVAAGSAPVAAFECTPATAPPPQVQPRNPSKDGSMVYLTSTRPVLVCVTDASGTVTRQQITPDQGQSFFGKAPWQVQAASLRDLQFFFQGARIVVPRNATDRIELIERTN